MCIRDRAIGNAVKDGTIAPASRSGFEAARKLFKTSVKTPSFITAPEEMPNFGKISLMKNQEGIYLAYLTDPAAVSYTHLDVYKRQLLGEPFFLMTAMAYASMLATCMSFPVVVLVMRTLHIWIIRKCFIDKGFYLSLIHIWQKKSSEGFVKGIKIKSN